MPEDPLDDPTAVGLDEDDIGCRQLYAVEDHE